MKDRETERRAAFRKKTNPPARQATVGGSLAMQIEDIKRDNLTPSEIEVLKEDTRRWKRMGDGGHLDDWLAYGSGEMIRRRLAMRLANTNRPEGRGYVEALSQLRESDGLGHIDKTSIGAVLWLHDDPERLQVLREMREVMTPGARSRLNSPISARQRVEKVIKARKEGTEDKVKTSPVAMLKEQLLEKDREIARLKHDLAKHDVSSLFDLKHDTAKDIALVIVGNVGELKAKDIAKRITEQFKQRQKPAG
jgi:hypothetical protein